MKIRMKRIEIPETQGSTLTEAALDTWAQQYPFFDEEETPTPLKLFIVFDERNVRYMIDHINATYETLKNWYPVMPFRVDARYFINFEVEGPDGGCIPVEMGEIFCESYDGKNHVKEYPEFIFLIRERGFDLVMQWLDGTSESVCTHNFEPEL